VQKIMTSTLGVALLLTAAATLYKATRGKQLPRTLAGQELAQAPAAPLVAAAAVRRCHRHAGDADLGGCRRHWRDGAAVAVSLAATAPHRGGRHCLCRAADAGGGLGHASLGSVDWPLLAKLLAGSLPGIWLGSRLMPAHPSA
jgi:hypothetical protein